MKRDEIRTVPLDTQLAADCSADTEAAMEQTALDRRLNARRNAIEEGRGVRADTAYFDALRARARARMAAGQR